MGITCNKIMKIISIKISIFILFISLIIGCKSDSDDDKNIPDVSNIKTTVNILRFEQDLFAIDTNNAVVGIQHLEAQYPKVADEFFTTIIGAKPPHPAGSNPPQMSLESTPQYYEMVRQFIADMQVRKTMDTCQIVFKNFDPYKKQLEQAARFYKYYFPIKADLTFITFVSQYNYDVFPFGRDTIGIGLDFYLGENHSDYEFMETLRYGYVRRTLTPEHLVAKTMRMQIAQLAGDEGGNRMLDVIVHNGKQLYILDLLLPTTPDSIKFGYSAAQTQWCKDNESGIWASFLKNNVVYETNFKKIAKLISPSPNSPGMPPEAPGETGNFIGWQIVKQYMKRFPKTSLTELLSLKDAQMVLEQSKYKPRR